MNIGNSILFTFDDGRAVAFPFPATDRMAAVFAAVVVRSAPCGRSAVVLRTERIINQLNALFEGAVWKSAPDGTAITGASITYNEAKRLISALLNHYLGKADETLASDLEPPAFGETDPENLPLGELLEIFRARDL